MLKQSFSYFYDPDTTRNISIINHRMIDQKIFGLKWLLIICSQQKTASLPKLYDVDI